MSESTAIIASIWLTVVALLSKEGRMINFLAMRKSSAIPESIIISRVITITDSHAGSIFFMVRAGYADMSRNLSAMGSRYAPINVLWFSTLAIKPSSPSVIPASMNIIKAIHRLLLIRKIINTETRRILNMVRGFGMFIALSLGVEEFRSLR